MDNSTDYTRPELVPIITTVALRLFHVSMCPVWVAMAVTGIVLNFLNLRTFLAMGLEDSVAASFFMLTVSDFCICSIALVEWMAFLVTVLERECGIYFYLKPLVPALYIMCLRRIFNTTTILITTFLAVQRCLCVVLPFQFKGMFTKAGTFWYTAIIFVFSVTCHALYVWRHEVVTIINLVHNNTQLVSYVPPGSEPYLYLMEFVIATVLNLMCQIIILICLVLIAVILRQSARFRQSASQGGTAATQNNSGKTSSKEVQALTQVALVSVIFIATNSPYFAFGIGNLLVPEFGVNLAYHNFFNFAINIMFTTELVNSSINFVVYYKYNSKFRECFHNWPKVKKIIS